MHGLNHIFANRSQVMVLRILNHAEEALTGRGIERLCGLSNRATMHALEELVASEIVYMEVSGRAHLYTLNHDHYLVRKAIMPSFEAEELFWADVRKTVYRIVRPRPIAALATGPLAREETEYGGRLMLTMLFSTGRGKIKSLASIETLAETIRTRYAMTLEHNLMDLNTMDEEEYEPLWRRVEREGILLFGKLP